MATASEIALQVVLQAAVVKQEFTVIGSATTMNFLFIVYHGTQVVKSQLEWINLHFSVVLTAVGLLCLQTLYRMIQREKEQEKETTTTTTAEVEKEKKKTPLIN